MVCVCMPLVAMSNFWVKFLPLIENKSSLCSLSGCEPASLPCGSLLCCLLLRSSALIYKQHPMNITAFNPQLDNISGTWMASVSERLLKELKICFAASEWLTGNTGKILFSLFSRLFLRILIFTFTFCVWQHSFMHKLLFRKRVSFWFPAGIAEQSQDKQVPVLKLFSVGEPFGTHLHASLPF